MIAESEQGNCSLSTILNTENETYCYCGISVWKRRASGHSTQSFKFLTTTDEGFLSLLILHEYVCHIQSLKLMD